MNATGIELLDRFGRVQAPDRKAAVGKDRRKSGGTSLRPEAPNKPGGRAEDEMETSARASLNGHTSRTYF